MARYLVQESRSGGAESSEMTYFTITFSCFKTIHKCDMDRSAEACML